MKDNTSIGFNTEIPEDKLVKFMAISNETLDEAKIAADEDNFHGGIIPQPWTIPYEKFGKYGVTDYFMEMVDQYMQTILWNGNVQSNLNTTIPGGPHTFWNARIAGGWVVSQKENDYIGNGWLGVEMSNINNEKNPTGIRINNLNPVGPASNSLKINDIIKKIVSLVEKKVEEKNN